MLLLPTFNADQVPATETGVDLDRNTIVPTYMDDLGNDKDQDMFSIQSPESIIIKPMEDFKATVSGTGWYTPENTGFRRIDVDTFTGDEKIYFDNAAVYYNTETSKLETLDIIMEIKNYNMGEVGTRNYFDINVVDKLIEMGESNVDIETTMTFVDNDGNPVKNKTVELALTDFDGNAHFSFEKDMIVGIIAPTYNRVRTDDFTNPYFYMNLDNLIDNKNFSSNMRQFVNFKNTDFSEYRLGIYEKNNIVSIWDRWYSYTGISSAAEANFTPEQLNQINQIPHIGKSANISPGQNFAIGIKLDNTGKMRMDLGNQYTWSGINITQGVIIQSPDVANTSIEKNIKDANANNIAEQGEKINYTVKVSNNSESIVANMVKVYDSLIKNTPAGLKYNNDIQLSDGAVALGDVNTGEFYIKEIPRSEFVEITYSFTIEDLELFEKAGATSIKNLATDNNTDPTQCTEITQDIDCDSTEITINGKTNIAKSLTESKEDGIATKGETLNYNINVENAFDRVAYNVAVRDSIFENTLPSNLTIKNVEVKGSNFDVIYTGSFDTKDLVIEEIPVGSSVDITYEIVVNSIPEGAASQVLNNIATDNGQDPTVLDYVCSDDPSNCDEVTIPFAANTVIVKSLVENNSGNNEVVKVGDELTYAIKVENTSDVLALDVIVRDSILEQMPAYIELIAEPSISNDSQPAETTGAFSEGNFTIAEIPAKTSVVINYVIKVNTVDDTLTGITNIATDNGDNPTTIEVDVCVDNVDCSFVVVPTEKPIEESPSDVQIDETPSDVQIDETPSDVQIDETPSDVQIDETPSDVQTDETPSDVQIDETPSDVQTDETPSDVQTDEIPSDDANENDDESTGKSEISLSTTGGKIVLVITGLAALVILIILIKRVIGKPEEK